MLPEICITGYFNGTVDFDPNSGISNLTANVGADIFISKVDSTGSLIWVKAIRSDFANDVAYGIAVDSSGNVYTTGHFQGTADFDPNAGTFNLTAGGSSAFVYKLDTMGNFVWAKAIGNGMDDRGHAIALDAASNVYTTGYFTGTGDFDPNLGINNLISAGGRDVFVSKLDASGNFVWSKAMGGAGLDIVFNIACDALGSVYTTGYFEGTADFDPSPTTINITVAGAVDIFVSKLDTNGNFAWAKAMGGTSSDYGSDIAIDEIGNVYTIGNFNSTADFDPNTGVSNLTSAGGDDIFVYKMSVTAAALNFDGVNDYLNCGNSTSFNLTGSLTVQAYINRATLNTDDCIIGKDNFASSTGYSFWVYQNNKLIFRLGNRQYSSVSNINQNVWTHVAATYNGGIVNLYINGVLDATFSAVAPPVSNTNGLFLGTPQDAVGNSAFAFSGTIDEVRLWNRALSQAEIMNNMNCELPAGQTGLLAYYQFNQGQNGANNSTVNTLTDISGNGNTGTLTNFALSGANSNWVLPGGVATGIKCPVFLSSNNFEFTSNISVYPNPSNNTFSIDSDAYGTVVVYDVMGKIIKTENVDLGVTKLDLSNCPNGIYSMKVTNDKDESKTVKLIKQ